MNKNLFSKAVVGTIVLTALSATTACSSSDEPEINPGQPAASVKTQFSIALPGNVAGTRASVETVQGQTPAVFRGMTGITLIPYAASPVAAGATRLGGNISLGNIAAATELGTNSNAKLYANVDVPIGTSAFLFYAKANDGPVTTAAQKFQFGQLTEPALTGENGTFTFKPQVISTATTPDAKATALATYLTTIAAATDGTTAWSATTNTGMLDLYNKFISIAAGSSANVLAAVQDLYLSLKSNTDPLAVAIRTAINNATYVTATGDDLALTAAVAGYPANINLPDGAAVVKWDNATSAFKADPTATQTYNGMQITSQDKFVYMPNLYYTVNTPVKTMAGDQTPLYNNTNSWDDILNGYTGAASSVTSTTRSVALVNKVQYAVGRLDTKVTLGATTLYDHNGDAVTVDDNSFPVTGILIGGQKDVDFKFMPTGSTEYTIYDNAVVTGMKAAAAGSAVNHTLALETANATTVYMAVELQNNTTNDFIGANGVIPAGSKFYLIAKLDPADGTGSTITQVFKQDYVTTANLTIQAGTAKDGTPGFTNPIGLGNAYNVIPDLRTPKLSLGLSVDLTWQSGLTFNVNL